MPACANLPSLHALSCSPSSPDTLIGDTQNLQKPFERARGASDPRFSVCYLIPKTQEVIADQRLYFSWKSKDLVHEIHGFSTIKCSFHWYWSPKCCQVLQRCKFCVPADELMRQQDGFSALGFWIKTKMLQPKFKKFNFWVKINVIFMIFHTTSTPGDSYI